jgi:hypothetical protein
LLGDPYFIHSEKFPQRKTNCKKISIHLAKYDSQCIRDQANELW